MREVGVIVWVILLIVGVTSSIVSSIRKTSATQQRPGLGPVTAPPRQSSVKELVAALQAQAQAQAQAAQPQSRASQPQSRAAAPMRPAPQPAKAAATARRSDAPPELPWPVAPARRSSAHRIFAGRGDAVRGIIAAEILGSPRGLRDEPFWR
jgi:hypothetical protein